MPLIKSSSSKAVGENYKKEMESSKPKKQALAIALSVQRKEATGKRKKTLEDAYARHIEENA
jgi:hypothetical protein